ncbi:MAG: hypothetical protein MW690_000326 [Methanophagales archaeon]|nr:hypothetical protein [Methanophagales archaeon]
MRADLIVAEQAEQAGQAGQAGNRANEASGAGEAGGAGGARGARGASEWRSSGRRCGNNSTNPVLILLYCLHHARRTDDSEASFPSEDSSF